MQRRSFRAVTNWLAGLGKPAGGLDTPTGDPEFGRPRCRPMQPRRGHQRCEPRRARCERATRRSSPAGGYGAIPGSGNRAGRRHGVPRVRGGAFPNTNGRKMDASLGGDHGSSDLLPAAIPAGGATNAMNASA